MSLLALLILAGPIMFPVLTPAHAQPAQHAPIIINSNDDFTSDNGVTSGTGTSNDPYMIMGWTIQTTTNPAISIRNTDAYFVISDVSTNSGIDGIIFNDVQNGQLQNTHVQVSDGYAVNIYSSNNVQVSNNDLKSGRSVVFLNWSSSINIRDNTILGGPFPVQGGPFVVQGFYLSDVTITGNSGDAASGILLSHVGNIFISQNRIRAVDPYVVNDCADVTIDGNTAVAARHDAGIAISSCGSFEIHGNTVQGENTVGPPAGISVKDSSNFDVSANNVTGFNVGLSLVSAAEFSVDSFQCPLCGTGILANGTSAGLIQNSQVSGGYYGLRMDSSDNILVQNNRLRVDGFGLTLKDSSSIELTNNEMSGGSGNMFQGRNLSQVTIRDNYGTAEEGANLIDIRNVSILNNSFNASHDGLIVRRCSDVTIAGNQASGFNRPIGLEDCTNASISRNTASFSRSGEIFDAGISLIRSTGISISDNQVTQNQVGILLGLGATGNAANDNVISNNTCGIQTDQSTVDQNDLSNNTFQANTQDYCSA